MRLSHALTVLMLSSALAGCSWFGGNNNQPAPTLRSAATEPATPTPPAPPAPGPVATAPRDFSPGPAATEKAPEKTPVAGGTYHVVIASYAKAENATAAIKFLGDHGVPANTATLGGKTVVVSTEGFASRAEADGLRQKIAAVGAQHPDAKKAGKSVWADAYIRQIK